MMNYKGFLIVLGFVLGFTILAGWVVQKSGELVSAKVEKQVPEVLWKQQNE